MTRNPSPNSVSRELRKAGFQKAGRYTPFNGYVGPNNEPQDGFIVKADYEYDRSFFDGKRVIGATVLCTIDSYDRTGEGREVVAQMATALKQAGFNVEIKHFDSIEVR